MKALIRKLGVRLQRLPPIAITAIGLGCLVPVGAIDSVTHDRMSFVLLYVLVVAFVGWGAGKSHAVFVSGVAVITITWANWILPQGTSTIGWVIPWNISTRLLVFSIAGWLTAEVTRLTRHLSQLVEDRTAQWKAEVEEHKATSTRLGEALERFEQVINNITEVFWLTDVAKNQMAYISPGYERIWGRKCEDLYREPRSWAAAIHPAERDEVLRRAQTDQAAGSYDVEYRILRPDGAVRWIRDRAFPVRNHRGEVCRIAGIADDITEWKQTREMLQMQAAILENMAEGVVVTDEKGVIVQMNPAGERTWGYERNEVLGQPVSVLSALPEPEATTVMQEVLTALQATGSWRGTFKNRRKDGAIIFCDAVISRLEIQGRGLLVAVEQDVTERLRAQEQLQMQARVLESMAEAVLMTDETGTIVLTNPALDAVLGYGAGELKGQPMHLLSGVSILAHNQIFKATVEQIERCGSAAGDYLARRKDGTLIEVQTRSSGMSVGGQFHLVVVGQDITERKQAEQALQQSEATLRVFLDAAPGTALLLDRNGALLAHNEALLRGLASAGGELIGKCVFDLFPPTLAESRKAAFDQVIRTREPAQFEDTRDGRHFLSLTSPVLDAAGNVTRVAVFALDITERKQAETVLQQSEQTYRALVETTGTGYLILDMEGRVLDANTEYVRLSGHETLREILGRSVVEWTAPNDQQRNAVAVEECLKSGAVRHLEIDYAGPNGLITSIEINGTVVQSRRGKIILSLCRDITGRKRAETELREAHDQLERHVQERTADLQAANTALQESEARLRLALDASNAGVWSWDAASNQSAWDKRYHELYGFEPDDPISFNAWIAQVHPEDRERLLAAIQKLRESGAGDTWNEEFRALHPVKGERWMAGFGRVERDPSGQAVRLAGINLDITECKRAEEALRDAHDTLEQHVEERTAELQAANAALAQSEERYRSLVNNLNVGVYRNTPGPDGRFIHANPALAQMHGYDSVEEFQKIKVTDLYQQPDERKAFVAELLRQGSVVNYELRLKKKDGTAIYASVHATVHRGPNGEVDWIDGMLDDITERKQAEAALRASQERYRALAESSPDAIFILDRDIKVQYVNSRAAALWRRAPEELIGAAQPELFPPEVAERHGKVVAEVFETGNLVRRELPLAFPTGDQWIEIRLVPLFGEQGTVSSVMGVCRDITERKRAERQLSEALELNQKMIAASVMGIAVYRASGECVFANEALAQTVGGSVSEVLQGNFRRLESWHKSGRLQMAEEALSQGQARSGEVYATTRFGKSIWLDCHLAPFVSNGQPHLLTMVLDITERKRAEEALRESETRLRAIISNAPVLLFAVNQDGIIRFEDGQALKALGAKAGANVGRSVMEAYAHIPAILENARRALRGEEFESIVEAGPVTFDCWYSPARDKEGKPAGYIGVATNITERHRLERQVLDISDREQARIGQDIHDGLCQHLVSLAFDANALLRELSAEKRPEAKTARRIADYLDQAITESRQLSRGLFPVRLGTLGLGSALHELAKSTSARFKIECRFDTQGAALVKHAGIATHLYRIAQEAVANAVKHGRARTVRIRLRARTNQIELRVEDNGAGLSPAKRKKATGLGLHIMGYRARAVGGTLQIAPRPRGGTVVSCCVPRPRVRE
jgi:PAS domain S-box-containing protein